MLASLLLAGLWLGEEQCLLHWGRVPFNKETAKCRYVLLALTFALCSCDVSPISIGLYQCTDPVL